MTNRWERELSKEFTLCERLIKFSLELPARHKKPSSQYEAILIGFYAKIISEFQSIVILCKKGRGLSAWPLLRVIFEGSVNLSYISLSPEKRAHLYFEHNLVEKKCMLDDLETLDPNEFKLLEKRESRAWWPDYLRVKKNYPCERTWDYYEDDKGNKKPLTTVHMVKRISEESGSDSLKNIYPVLYGEGSKFIHSTIMGLQNYLTKQENGSVALEVGPSKKEIDTIIGPSYGITVLAMKEVVEIFSPDLITTINEFEENGKRVFLNHSGE